MGYTYQTVFPCVILEAIHALDNGLGTRLVNYELLSPPFPVSFWGSTGDRLSMCSCGKSEFYIAGGQSPSAIVDIAQSSTCFMWLLWTYVLQ